jgi:hypothetical protein
MTFPTGLNCILWTTFCLHCRFHSPFIIAIKLTGVELCSFVAPGDVMQRELHAGQCDVANLIDFWRVSKKLEAESCDGVAEANAEV